VRERVFSSEVCEDRGAENYRLHHGRWREGLLGADAVREEGTLRKGEQAMNEERNADRRGDDYPRALKPPSPSLGADLSAIEYWLSKAAACAGLLGMLDE
jgi:hypothetical protein